MKHVSQNWYVYTVNPQRSQKPKELGFGRVMLEPGLIYRCQQEEFSEKLLRYFRIYTTSSWEEFGSERSGFFELEILDRRTLKQVEIRTYRFPACNTLFSLWNLSVAKGGVKTEGVTQGIAEIRQRQHQPSEKPRQKKQEVIAVLPRESEVSPEQDPERSPAQTTEPIFKPSPQPSPEPAPNPKALLENSCLIALPENSAMIMSLWQTLTDWVFISQCFTGGEWRVSRDIQCSQFVLTNGKQDKILLFNYQDFRLSLIVPLKLLIQMLGEIGVTALVSDDPLQVQAARRLLALLSEVVDLSDSRMLLKRLLALG
jgi:hypothetical protein